MPVTHRPPKVALVHDWLVARRGGERVLEAIAQLVPDAPVYTLFCEPSTLGPVLRDRRIVTSSLNASGWVRARYRYLLPVLPWAIEQFDLRDFDVVISSSHCVAKNVRVSSSAVHLSYVHAPMRYMWERFDDYFAPGRARLPVRFAARGIRPWFQALDVARSRRVDDYVANSQFIARQIERHYGRTASVIYPPVDVEKHVELRASGGGRGGYFVVAGALVPYKRIDLAIDACALAGVPLWIVGDGPERARLEARAGPAVRFLGALDDDAFRQTIYDARALLFPGVEDFGIVPVEAQALGRPVVAFYDGGATESVTSTTGIFVREQSAEAFAVALANFPDWEQSFSPEQARRNAMRFRPEVFREAMAGKLRALGCRVPHLTRR